MAEIITFPGAGYECNSYLIVDEKSVLIDSGTGLNTDLLTEVNKITKKIDLVVNTHAHLDHVGGNSFFPSEILAHEADLKELESGGLYGTAALFSRKASSRVDRVLKEGDLIDAGTMNLTVIHTPGHTPGSICLLSDTGHLFSGDTLFSGGSFGRTDLQRGSTSELLRSLERLKSIDFEFLMPGHMECVRDGRKHLEAALKMFGDMYERI